MGFSQFDKMQEMGCRQFDKIQKKHAFFVTTMAWNKINIQLENGETAQAQAPIIVSASRSTDIPAFYADWFFHRLKVGYSAWINPFNGVKSYVAYRDVRFIVFWSKNPRPLIKYLPVLRERGIGCYVQYSLNNYETEGLEKVPPLASRVETFKELVGELGVGGVVWRFDPLILTDSINTDSLLERIEGIGDKLKGYTEKLVFSFADIIEYRKVKANLEHSGIKYRVWTEPEMLDFASRLARMNAERGWNYELATCGERVDLAQFGVKHNHCIDDTLMIRRAYSDPVLMDFLGAGISEPSLFEAGCPEGAIELPDGRHAVIRQNNRDKGQRALCGCMVSKDIGQYNTCIHGCEYCYANDNKAATQRNYETHRQNPNGETITGI